MNMQIKKKYVCTECDTAHDFKSHAELCCPVEVIEVYECPQCHETHDYEESAINCCDKDSVKTINPLELEKAGQTRLFA